jgi:hypothetical protein
MKPNIGNLDRTVRIAVGLVLVSLVFVGPRTPWGRLGLVPPLTGFSGFFPLHLPFRIDRGNPR